MKIYEYHAMKVVIHSNLKDFKQNINEFHTIIDKWIVDPYHGISFHDFRKEYLTYTNQKD